jgi:pyruvate kinase
MSDLTDSYQPLFDTLVQLHADLINQADAWLESDAEPSLQKQNLAYYLALRQQDLSQLQHQLSRASLSSLAHSESHVLQNIQGLLELLARLTDSSFESRPALSRKQAHDILRQRTEQLFGRKPAQRETRIMVTLPTQAAWDKDWIEALIESGTDCFRINCAHDSPKEWSKMVEHIRRSEDKLKTQCKILFDLAGHKLRTASVKNGPPILHLKPTKTPDGKLLDAAKILFYPAGLSPEDLPANNGTPALPLPLNVHNSLKPADIIRFEDARQKLRIIKLQEQTPDGNWIGLSEKPCYLVPGLELEQMRVNHKGFLKHLVSFRLPEFEGQPENIRIFKGDPILLSPTHRHCHSAKPDTQQHPGHPTILALAVPKIIEKLKPKDPVWIDDGKLGCEVEKIDHHGAWLRAKVVGAGGAKIKADKGVNFPETDLQLPPLSQKDELDLEFVARHADLVALSFVEDSSDIKTLNRRLKELGRENLPIIAKIETRNGVKNLSRILLDWMERQPFGVMIARGDLAIELGSVRMAELQEDILWLCEAAQTPVIWATQVLENLTKNGTVSRPEISDAAMSVHAECVMLNKGAYLPEAVKVLDTILSTLEPRHAKKHQLLKPWTL